MQMKNIAVMVLAVLAVLWLGGWALGLMKHIVFAMLRLAVLAVAAAVIIQLLLSRRG